MDVLNSTEMDFTADSLICSSNLPSKPGMKMSDFFFVDVGVPVVEEVELDSIDAVADMVKAIPTVVGVDAAVTATGVNELTGEVAVS